MAGPRPLGEPGSDLEQILLVPVGMVLIRARMTVDSVVCLFGSLLSLWLCLQAQAITHPRVRTRLCLALEVLQDLELQEHLVRKAGGRAKKLVFPVAYGRSLATRLT